MQWIVPPPQETRLQDRYHTLVQAHLRAAPELAAGVAALPSSSAAMAATQGAWRYFNNDRVSLSDLVQPLRSAGRDAAAAVRAPFLLLVHDWSKLDYRRHTSKKDVVQLTHATDVGYELTTALLVSPDGGQPLAPMEMHLRTADGLLSTRGRPRATGHLEQVLPTMQASGTWDLPKPLVHVIDREADSVDHYRRWHAAGHKFLVRADDRRVRWGERSRLLSEIREELRRQGVFRAAGAAVYQGRPARLWVAETEVVLHRPAKKNVAGIKYPRPGRPLKLRLVAAEVRDESGAVLAGWLLLSNVPTAWAGTALLAFCYYWRWKVESFFKLLKGHGQHVEAWQQETGMAIARRLLVAAMACVVVWRLQADDSPAAVALKDLLVRLSGRQVKRKRPHTAPALLSGLWVLLSMMALLEQTSLHDLGRLAAAIPYLHSG